MRCLTHAFGDTLRFQVAGRPTDRLALRSWLRLPAQLGELLLQSFGASGEPLLVCGRLPPGVAAACRLAGPLQLFGDATFGIGELPGLELQVAQLPPPIVGSRSAESLLGPAQPLERPIGVLAGAGRILLLQVAGGAAHLVGGVAQRLPAGPGVFPGLPLALSTLRLGLAARLSLLALLSLLSLRLPLWILLARLPRLAVLRIRGLVRRLPLTVGLLRHLPRQLLELASQRLLIATEPLQAPFQRLGVELVAVPGQVALLPAHALLPTGQLAQPLERVILGALVLPGLRRRRRLVVGLLLLAQLLIEERRQVGRVAIAAATAAALLARHLSPLARRSRL